MAGPAGAIEDVSLVDVLQVLAITAQTGTLSIEIPERSAELTYVDGRITRAMLSPHYRHLASYFLRRGWIDFDILHEALTRQSRGGEHALIGQILIALGALTGDQLREGLRWHVRDIVSEVIGSPSGDFAFTFGGSQPEVAEAEGIWLAGDDLRLLAGEEPGSGAATEESLGSLSAPAAGPSLPPQAQLVMVLTDAVLVQHGLELALQAPHQLVALSGVHEVGRRLLASSDQRPTLIVDLDLLARSKGGARPALQILRGLRRQWPNLQLVTFGRRVPEPFYGLVQHLAVMFHLPRPSVADEENIGVVRDFMEALARVACQKPTSTSTGAALAG